MNIKLQIDPGGDVLELSKEPVQIGRAGADVVIDDPGCSRRHAKLYEGPAGELRVSDVQSTNGTYVGNERVIDKAITVGSVIQIAGRTITVLEYSASGRYSNMVAAPPEEAKAFTPLVADEEETRAPEEEPAPEEEEPEEKTQILATPPPLRPAAPRTTQSGIKVPPPLKPKSSG